jgi:DNA-binding beta-propeller fold protein YncE
LPGLEHQQGDSGADCTSDKQMQMKWTWLAFSLATVVLAADGYHLLKKFPIPGDGGWDYLTVDPDARRVYVSHASQVQVLDSDSGAVLGSITAKGSHGIALANEFGRGFVTNGTGNNVTVFDLKTLKPISSVPTGDKPDAILYDRATKRVFANNGGGDSSTVINAADGKVLGTVDLGGAPESSAADGKGFIFTNLEDKSEMVKINAAEMKVVARWKLGACEKPSALAMDQANRRLFAGCRNHVMAMVNADTGAVILTEPIGDHVDAAAFDALTKKVFLSNGDGTINVFHEDSPDTLGVLETIRTQAGAKTVALDTKTHRLFLPVAEYEAREGKKRSIKPGSFELLVFGK